jgi:hypothetical protein
MRNSYIANSAEALNIHNGTQTAIVVAMKLPKWCKRIELQGDNPNDPKCYSLVDFDGNNATGSNGEYLTLMDIAPYALGQEVYVRESYVLRHKHMRYYYKADHTEFAPYAHDGWKSAATMPKSAARTRFKIVGCEAVRVLSLQPSHLLSVLKGEYKELINYTLDKPHINLYDYIEDYIITRFGQSAWDNNDYIWYYKIENQ